MNERREEKIDVEKLITEFAREIRPACIFSSTASCPDGVRWCWPKYLDVYCFLIPSLDLLIFCLSREPVRIEVFPYRPSTDLVFCFPWLFQSIRGVKPFATCIKVFFDLQCVL